ncbi:MAG: hypothetical protein HFE46_05495 [Clostridia bacterium]|nr:hypothetical protein [Clostridia bacterium]
MTDLIIGILSSLITTILVTLIQLFFHARSNQLKIKHAIMNILSEIGYTESINGIILTKSQIANDLFTYSKLQLIREWAKLSLNKKVVSKIIVTFGDILNLINQQSNITNAVIDLNKLFEQL